ncbi:hypothetical protein [Occallatibacter savannae]|uniref:hypothetical protein n=1 Tax=Occallatibacter savannae TaxID=1002691 RepID=UPI000D686C9B|nr:hypothetical protein [Occallatibacter savannae]
MTKSFFRNCVMAVLGLAAVQMTLAAQERGTLEGDWDVSVTVTNCQTGAPIRVVRSIQAYHHDGSFTETANSASRGISEGVWSPAGGQNYVARYWFFRYKADGTFASFASAHNTVSLGTDGHFTATGTIQDYDANGNLLSTGCVVQTAYLLATRKPTSRTSRE